jgi:hypothetical protein
MADPQLLVDQPDRLVDRGAAIVGDLDVRKGEELQDAVLVPPQGAQFVRRPATLHGGDDLVILPLMIPAMRRVIRLEHVDRRGVFLVLIVGIENRHISVSHRRNPRGSSG